MSKATDCFEKVSAKGYRHRDGSPVLTPEDFERVSKAADPVAEVQRMIEEASTRYSTADPFEQVMGERNAGAGKPLRSKAASQTVAKSQFFDSAVPVNAKNTAKAVALAQEWNDPALAPDLVQRLLDANEGDALIIGTAQGELYKYALKLAAKGQMHLLDFFNLTSNTWGMIGRNENVGVSEIGALLAGRRDYSQSTALNAAKKVDGAREEAEGKTLPPETSKAITTAVTTTKLDKPAVRKVKGNVKDKEGETLEEKVEKNVADVTALSLLERFAKSQSDTLSWAPKGQENKIRALVRAALTLGPKAKMWDRVWLINSLVDLGVTPELASQLTETVAAERARIGGLIKARAEQQAQDKVEALAEGTAGSLRGLEDMLLSVPASQQQDPVWRLQAATEYFTQLGLSPQRAAAAARAYNIEFGARLADAVANAVERVAATSAPWQKKLASVGAPTRKKLLTDMDKLMRAVRAGVTDPDTHWYNVVAQQNGWRGFTAAQHVRLNEIDEALMDPTIPEYRKNAMRAEVQDMVARANTPPEIADYIVSSYTLSALSGLPTAFVQFSAPISVARDFVTDFPFNPVVATRALMAAGDSMLQEAIQAGKTDVYNHQIGEHLRDSVPAMRELLERGLKNFQSSNPLTKATGAFQIFTGAQHYIGRMLSAIDEGAIAAAEVYKTSMFTSRQLRAMGMTRNDAGAVVLASLDARNEAVAANMAGGMSRSEATTAANEVFRRRIYQGIEGEYGTEAADDIAKGAEREGLGMVGRLSEGINNTDEGSLRTPINHLLDALAKMYSKGGKLALGARLAFGFVSIPFRAAMWYSGYSPYGFVRYARHKSRQRRGLPTHWQQSFGTRAQEQQRFRDATMGTIALLLAMALRSNSGDDDPEESDILKFIFTGKGPSDPVTRQAWNRRFQPYSLTIKVGKSYFSMNLGRAGESMAWPLALAGALDDVALTKKGKLARNPGATFRDVPELFGSYWGSLSQRSAFQGFSTTTDRQNAVEADNLFKKAVFTSSAFMPWKGAMSSATRMASNPVDNKTMSGVIFANTPIVGPMLGRPALNNLGDPLGDRTLAGRLYREGVPLIFRVRGETERVYDLILQQGRGPAAPKRSELEQQYGPLSPDQFYEFNKERGALVKAAMNEKFDRLQAMDPEQFGDALQTITRTANRKAAKAVGLRK